MAIQIPIDHSKLTDSPYSKVSASLFTFSASDAHDLVNDIVNGNPGCYLISGYRGSGKTSLIAKLEEEVKAKSGSSVFVRVNLTKYETRFVLLRKIIRAFYLQLTESENNKPLFDTLQKEKTLEGSFDQLDELWERTFQEVKVITTEKEIKTRARQYSFGGNWFDIVYSLIAIGSFLILTLNLDLTQWQSYLPIAAFGLVAFTPLLRLISFRIDVLKEKQKSKESNKIPIYDEELTEHYLLTVLASFNGKVKPIFILDELDKLDSPVLVDNIITDLKPLMLSGSASFILVAGQHLYYKYYHSHTIDDSLLSSLFSKLHHVSLFTTAELRTLFKNLITVDISTLPKANSKFIESYIDYLIIKSRRIPRLFILLIRQDLNWGNDNTANLEISLSPEDLRKYSSYIQAIEKTQNQMAVEGYPLPISDYVSMQLFLKVNSI